jgi:16S rRNA (uracil1498-N3)-methyltransferase
MEAKLPPHQAHHLVHVLRLNAGDALTVFDGGGAEYSAVITRIARGEVAVAVEAEHTVERESPLNLTLVQGISRSSRMDYTVQKAVELGIARIEPVLTRRGVVRLNAADARRKVTHWQAVAVAACEQSGRNRIPDIATVKTLDEWLSQWSAQPHGHCGLLLDPQANRRLSELPRPPERIALVAGPEGGLTEEEHRAGERLGLTSVRVGPRVLRTETAALAALAALQALWGDF